MSDIAAFLLARLDEDERIAQGAARTDDGLGGNWIPAAIASKWLNADARVDDHVAAHDPARVLREVAAKRALLALHEPQPFWGNNPPPRSDQTPANVVAWHCECQCPDGVILGEYPCETALLLAAPYSDHPDYDPSWSVS